MKNNLQLTVFFTFFSLILAVTFAMNFLVDVSGSNSEKMVSDFGEAQKPYQTLISDSQFDQRAWVRSFIVKKKICPELLIIGSSTIGMLSQDMFTDKILNIWLSGPTIEDYEAIYAMLNSVECRPSKVLLAVDPWFFNKHTVSNRWETLISEYLAFHSTAGRKEKEIVAFKRSWSQFKDRLSFVTTVESLKKLINRNQINVVHLDLKNQSIHALCESNYLAAFPVNGEGVYMRAYDGHFETCRQFIPTKEEIRKISETYLLRNMHSMEDWREINMDSMNRLDVVIDKFVRTNSEVVLLIPPYNPLTYTILLGDKTVSDNLTKMKFELRKISEKHFIHLIDIQDPKDASCSVEGFNDSHHVNEKCAIQIASKIKTILEADDAPKKSGLSITH